MAFIQINRQHFFHNLQTISEHLKSKDRVAIVLKDNAYGHDLEIMAKLSREFGITRAYVRTLEEAESIWQQFRQVSVLHDIPESLPPHGILIVLNSLEQITRVPISSHVELKVDSGMHRNGIQPEELDQAFALIRERRLDLCGVLTHMRSGDDLNSDLFWQQQNFKAIKQRVLALCEQHGLQKPFFHSSSSSAAFRQKEFTDDFARIGIAAYGYLENDPVFEKPDLKPVMSLWAEKLVTSHLKAGSRIGYGGMSTLDEEMTLSTYDIGYGDGFFRLNESHSFTTPSGQKILPRVSMDYVSVTGEENPLCLFNDAMPLAKLFDTISYDILVKLNSRIPRLVV